MHFIVRNSETSQKQSVWYPQIIPAKINQKLNQLNTDLHDNTKTVTETISISVKFLNQINEICKNLPLGEYLEFDNYFCELQIKDIKCEFSFVYYDENANLPNQLIEAIHRLKEILLQKSYVKLFYKINNVVLHPLHFPKFKNDLAKKLKKLEIKEIAAETDDTFSVIVSTKNDDKADEIIHKYIKTVQTKINFTSIGNYNRNKFTILENCQNSLWKDLGIKTVFPKTEHENCIFQGFHCPTCSKIEISQLIFLIINAIFVFCTQQNNQGFKQLIVIIQERRGKKLIS